ncbi:hypothetical protein C492_02392 [Natronococcus jeotgali DSM 18795]|uniref:Uncharacterized protein n=1 Tax=Natronococcus jeotgali DSM 18795 TaxID=1227498 RepID=L9XX81_9EURY|nr:hypothetical protein C492_02392 [Natronococcus jeotgali DSM 18795]
MLPVRDGAAPGETAQFGRERARIRSDERVGRSRIVAANGSSAVRSAESDGNGEIGADPPNRGTRSRSCESFAGFGLKTK